MRELAALTARVEAARPERLALCALERSATLDRFGRAWLAALDARKRALGPARLRRHDRPRRAAPHRPGVAAWVLWRLDGGIDHILVDEAQDTSPAQWRVIEAISAEFFAGAGAREAAAHHLRRRRREAVDLQLPGRRPGGVRRPAAPTTSACSARSARRSSAATCSVPSARRAPILALVDAVFAGPAGAGLATPVTHHPHRAGGARPGRALAVPAEAREARGDALARAGGGACRPTTRSSVLADRIADRIAGWLRDRQPLPDGGRLPADPRRRRDDPGAAARPALRRDRSAR